MICRGAVYNKISENYILIKSVSNYCLVNVNALAPQFPMSTPIMKDMV